MMPAYEPLRAFVSAVANDDVDQSHNVVEATFMPRRRQNIQPEAQRFIGWRGQWQALWRISEEDGGDYIGQTMWMPRDGWPWFGWAPDEDLQDPAPLPQL